MPSVSIYLDDEALEDVDDQLGPDDSRSEWIQTAIRRQLDHEHDDIESLEEDMNDLEDELSELKKWKEDVMDDLVEWFKGEFGPSN